MKLHAAGIGSRAGSFLYGQWSEFLQLRDEVLKHRNMDDIHDLRVASRRIRAIVGLFSPYIPPKMRKGIVRSMRKTTRELGRLRNIDEAQAYFGVADHELPAISSALVKLRKEEMKSVARLLQHFPLGWVDGLLRNSVANLAGQDNGASSGSGFAGYLSEEAQHRFQVMIELLPAATAPEQEEERHLFRIAVKKWRYLLETLAHISGQDYRDAIAGLKEYQTALGNLNDMVEFEGLCEALKLPDKELATAHEMLAKDKAHHLAHFLELAAAHPPDYTFKMYP